MTNSLTEDSRFFFSLLELFLEADGIEGKQPEQLLAAEWDAVAEQAIRHGLGPLLYHLLQAHGFDSMVPAEVEQRLRDSYLRTAVKNMRLYHSLGQVLGALNAVGIPVIVLKGIQLAEEVYGNIALRPMGDADILVHKADLPHAVETLLEMGYHPYRQFDLQTRTAHHHELPAFIKPDGVPIEIHWTIARPNMPVKVDVSQLWTRASLAVISGVKMQVLSLEDFLLHQCLHVSHQNCFYLGLRNLCDIVATIEHYQAEINWNRVQSLVREWEAERGVFLTFSLAREWLGAAVPVEVIRKLEPENHDRRVEGWAKERIFADQEDVLTRVEKFSRLSSEKPLHENVVRLVESLFPPREVMAKMYSFPLHSPRVFLYYPVRLKDLFAGYAKIVWQRFRGEREMVAKVENKHRLHDWLA